MKQAIKNTKYGIVWYNPANEEHTLGKERFNTQSGAETFANLESAELTLDGEQPKATIVKIEETEE